MAVQTRPTSTTLVAVPRRPQLRIVEASPSAPQLHLFTYIVGSALFWTGWAAISVTADRWYWWPVVPLVGWGIVLAAHLWRASHAPRRPERRRP